MSQHVIERRVRRRSLHRSRSVAVSIALIVLVVVAAWIGTEAVLAAIGAHPLVATPQTLATTLMRPTPAAGATMAAVAAALAVLGIVSIALAVLPGHRHRTPVDHDRGAVIVDTRIVAATAANAASHAAAVPADHAVASVRRFRTTVEITPISGVGVDRDHVRAAVEARVAVLDPRFSGRVRVRIREKGTLA
ncbi:DUF6286 domain-containing protein [Curtobacterium ammoniigenes]|uniref:DUF6286 domain-containing protein n=1 Tax=Curtobacterium ammoniigenes TaxID=395387 RepID=UPI00082DC6EF|nr:DUF6286 domain-containing protein [Curtobacterium ammoniigenes]